MKKRSLDLVLNRKRRTSDKEYKAGDIVTDVKMETNFFIISDDEKGASSDTTLIADVKPSSPSLVGTSLLVTKAKSGQRHSQVVGSAKTENSANCKCDSNESFRMALEWVYFSDNLISTAYYRSTVRIRELNWYLHVYTLCTDSVWTRRAWSWTLSELDCIELEFIF